MPSRPPSRPSIGGQGNDPQPPARRRRGSNIGSLIAGATTFIDSVQAQNDRKRKQSLEERLLGERVADRKDRAADRAEAHEDRRLRQQRDALALDARLRGEGYIPEAEAGPDVHTPVKGQTLDALVNAASGSGIGMGVHGLKDMTPERYGHSVGGYQFDRMSPAARKGRADADWAERRAKAEKTSPPPRQPSYTERHTQEIQARIDELTGQGVPLTEANRQARLEAGSTAPSPSLESRVGIPSESPEARDNRRAADRDRLALNQTNREVTTMKRELGKFPTAADSSSGKVRRLEDLVARSDSLRGEFDKHSAAANSATLGRHGIPASPASPAAPANAELQADLVEARRAYEALLKTPGVDSAAARKRYAALVKTIRENHERR